MNVGRPSPGEPPPRRNPRHGRADVAVAAAIAAAVLFSQAAVTLAAAQDFIFEVPAAVLYVFAVWGAGIVVMYLLSRRGEKS